MGDNLTNAIFSGFYEQLRTLKETHIEGIQSVLKRLDSIEQDIKHIKDHISNNSNTKSQKTETFRMFSVPLKDDLPFNSEITSENKTKNDELMLDGDFVFPNRKSEKDFDDTDKFFSDLNIKSSEKEMSCFTLSTNSLKNIECRLYIKSDNEIKPSEIGQVLCSLSVVDNGKILEINNKLLSTTCKILLNKKSINEIQKKDGKKYIAIIFPEKSFEQLEGSKLKEFYLKFSDKENGIKFYEKIKEKD